MPNFFNNRFRLFMIDLSYLKLKYKIIFVIIRPRPSFLSFFSKG
jgi:hypothetical protein